MGGETSGISEIANKISKDIFKWFRWERIGLKDQNFDCLKQEKHSPLKRSQHTHPVDIVFKYDDPYLEHPVVLNTDLKSYAKSSIQPSNIRASLKSLAHTIDCARVSSEWKTRYDPPGNAEVRGLLFVYNHDNDYDRDFFKHIDPANRKKTDTEDAEDSSVNLDSLPIDSKQIIHILEPRTIAYLTTIVSDIHRLNAEDSFPIKNYFFFYPELKLHRTRGDLYKRPATIELLCGPFFVVGHDEVQNYDEVSKGLIKTYDEGYIVFYNRPGESTEEFMYLFDVLSSYQFLDGDSKIRIRVAHHLPNQNIRSIFKAAINMYIVDWGFDDYKKERLESIEFEVIEIQKTSFSQVELGWDRK